MTNKCLNCNSNIENNFCSTCGQKISTHRFSLQHFFVHDLIHGVFHVDKGFLYTIKELFTRPGHSIREYVQGKRANHFNYITFLLIIITIGHYLKDFTLLKAGELSRGNYSGFQKVAKEYYKIVPVAGAPLFSLISYFLFKKSKQNYTEHLVLNLYRLSAYLIMADTFTVITIFYNNVAVLRILLLVFFLLEIIYCSWFFYQYFSVFGYKKWVLILRSILVSILLAIINDILLVSAVEQIGLMFFH